MGSLWTPDGEHEVPPEPRPSAAGGDAGASAGAGADPAASAPVGSEPVPEDVLKAAAAANGIDLDSLDDAERAQLAAELGEMMRVRREVAATPASEMLANHMMRLFDLTTIYLESDPPAFGEAATVIEAFRAVLDTLGDRLGETEQPLTEALGQLQMLFVQVKDAAEKA
ncbi:MAG: hypothetical protein ACR2OH_11070 [Microthrixaceae bacterium]